MLAPKMYHLIDIKTKEILRSYCGSQEWVKEQTQYITGILEGSMRIIKEQS